MSSLCSGVVPSKSGSRPCSRSFVIRNFRWDSVMDIHYIRRKPLLEEPLARFLHGLPPEPPLL